MHNCDGRQVDFDNAELSVEWQLQRVGKQLIRRPTKTEDSDATLPLPPICLVALERQRSLLTALREEAGEAWQTTPLVITTRYGTPIEPRNFNRFWDRRCDAAGVRRIAMRILRHAQFSITMEIYTQASSAATREALRKLGERLDG